jgi:integrase
MASLSTNEAGLHRVYFKSSNGSRQIIYCGRMTKKQAEVVERCRIDGSIPNPATTLWLADVSADLHGKLAKHGLTQPRAAAVVAPTIPVVTLDDLIERYKSRPKFAALTDGTKVCHHYSFVRLREFFGVDRDITTIMETDAEDMVAALGENFAEATVARIAGAGSMLLRFGVRSRLITVNPFDGVRRGSFVSPHRGYVAAQTCLDIIEACPDLETKLVVAFARFAGLRTPSEPRVLLWKDVDWSGRRFRCDSPKTGPRVIPIVAELMRLLEQQFEAVPDGSEFVLPAVAAAERSTYPHRITRIVDRLQLVRWQRLIHTMRASRQTDWNEVFPAHVTAAWMGNSPTIGARHYNRTLDGHFDAATHPTHNPTQHMPATTRIEPQPK